MTKVRLQKNMVWLSALVFFMAFIGSTEGLVLCFGADGHLEIETTYNGVNCGHPPATTSKAVKYHPSLENNSICKARGSSCKDVPLKIQGLRQNSPTLRVDLLKLKAPVTSIASSLPSTFTKIVTKSFYREPLTDTFVSLTLIHTTVLLL